MPASTTLSPAEVAARLAGSVGNLARELKGAEPTSRSGVEWRWGKTGALGVHVAGPRQGRFFDNAEAPAKSGDALGLVAHVRGTSMAEAYRWALAWLGIEGRQLPADRPRPVAEAPKRREAPPDDRKRWSLDLGRKLWREAVPVMGSPAARYLAERVQFDLDLPADAGPEHPMCFFVDTVLGQESALRFHPAAWRSSENGPHGPAMVALMTNPATGEPTGAHVTYLRRDGSGKAEGPGQKIKLGNAGVIRLVPDAEVVASLGIAEGIETSLAVMHRYGWRPVWAAGDAGSIGRFPVLPGIEALTIFPDADDRGTSREAAEICTERWRAAGREVRTVTPPAGADFADLAGRAA